MNYLKVKWKGILDRIYSFQQFDVYKNKKEFEIIRVESLITVRWSWGRRLELSYVG